MVCVIYIEWKCPGPAIGMAITRTARVARLRRLAEGVATHREWLLDVDGDDLREPLAESVIPVGEAVVERSIPSADPLAGRGWKLGSARKAFGSEANATPSLSMR